MRELRWSLLKDHIEAAAKLRIAAVERLSELGPKEMSIANAIRAIKVAVDVERLSIGASTQNIAQSIERSGQGEAKDSQGAGPGGTYGT